ncbi:Inner membrane protein yeeA [Shimwellia blattae]|nr:Inner membrane protein yeeA [Shimwellia blattae]
METALWRSGDVIFGSLLAMLFTSIWPQRAFILWRIKMAAFISDFDRLHHAGFSPNLLERPHLETPLRTMLGNMEKLRTLVVPASKETRIPKSILDGIQTVARNMVCTLELQINAWWASRESHFLMINAVTLRETQRMTHRMLAAIELALHDGNLNAIQHASVRQAEIVDELRRLMKETSAGKMHEAPVYGYVWLSLELAQQLELLSQLVSRALRK